MNGFVGEFLILLGGFLWRPWFAAAAATGVILSAVYMLWMFQRVNYGEITNEKNRSLPDLSPREWAMLVPTIAMAIVMGVFPNVFLRPMEPAIRQTIERVTGRNFAAGQGPSPSLSAFVAPETPVNAVVKPALAGGRAQ
jgi:NADH-quinone oxidoreductase subunit M